MRTARRGRCSVVLLWTASCLLGLPILAGDRVLNNSAARAVDQMELAAGAPPETIASSVTGLVTFVSTRSGFEIPLAARVADSPELEARRFVEAYGAAFGLTGADGLELATVSGPDEVGMEHVRFRQVVEGVPVTGGELTVHLRGANVVGVNAKTLPGLEAMEVGPALGPDMAEIHAMEMLAKHFGIAEAELSPPRLELFNKGFLAGYRHPTRLAWFIEATGPALRQFVWIDAEHGNVLLHFSQLPNALNRMIYDADDPGDGVYDDLPGALVRFEGGPVTNDVDADAAYDYAGDTYDYFLNQHGRDSYDGAGAALISSVHFCPSAASCPLANAFWNGTQMVYGEGVSQADDVVAHELTHAVTDSSARLFYYMQSGALSESYSDIFGETVDLLNLAGDDSAGVRWQIGEDIPPVSPLTSPLRDMMDPTLLGDPGKMSDPQFVCADPGGDKGGVHANSGVPNHAYALMVDGGSYNGLSITGIGLTKAAKVQYRALTHYLLSASDFLDNYHALRRACVDLVGTAGISSVDCAEVERSLHAVEMSRPWPCSPPQAQMPLLCPSGGSITDLFFDDLETTDSGQWSTAFEIGGNHWTGGLGDHGLYFPLFAASGSYSFWGADVDATGDSWLGMSSDLAIPAAAVRMQFAHSYGFENTGSTYWDGGVIEYSTNGGSTWVDAGGLIVAGASYGGTIFVGVNPLGGRSAFGGDSYGYTATQLDLSSLGDQNVRFRFRIGTDSNTGDYGWFIDDIRVYTCTTLYDQTDFPGTHGTNSQQYEASEWAYDSMAADDFVVPPGETWDIDGLLVDGHYGTNAGPTPLSNVKFLSDSASLPGSAVCTYTALMAGVDFIDAEGVFSVQLPSTCSLSAGAYWLTVQADMDHTPLGQWYWDERTLQSGSAYVWQNPGDGFGSGCTSWTPGATCGFGNPDLLFSLWGERSSIDCFALSLSRTGSGSDPAPSPTNSPGCLAGEYHSGDVVSLTAAPDPGWVVAGWTGTDDDTSTSTVNAVTMPAVPHAASVAYAAIPCYSLTLGHSGSGADPSPSPTNSPGCAAGEYHSGDIVSLTAAPDPGWVVAGWTDTDDDTSTSTVNTVTMPAAAHAASVAYAAIPCYSLTLSHTGSGAYLSAAPSNSPYCALSNYHEGEVIALTADPDPYWSVSGWAGTDNNSSLSKGNTVTMPASAHAASVTYAPWPCYSLTLGHSGSGADPSASPNNSPTCPLGEYHAGELVTLSADPDPGWAVGGWTGTYDDASLAFVNALAVVGVHSASVIYVEALTGFVGKLIPSAPGEWTHFGDPIGVSGDTVVVGAPETGGPGVAYVYERDHGGPYQWGEVKKLVPSDGTEGAGVAISGDTIVIGAHRFWNSGDPGAVYVFERDHGGPENWGEAKKIQAPEAPDGDSFGGWVAIDGNRLAVGAWTDGASNQGAAWIFERDQGGPGNWGMVKKVIPSDQSFGVKRYFGWRVALEGDLMVVSELYNSSTGDAGSAYIFERNQGGANNWGEVAKKVGDNANDRFGGSVAVSGDTVAIGSYADDDTGSNAGSVSIYRRNTGGAGNWGLVRKLQGDGDDSLLGFSATLVSDFLVAGAPHTLGSAPGPGVAQVFVRDLGGADNWGELDRLFAYDGIDGDRFGQAAAMDGATIVIASMQPLVDHADGAAYIFELQPTSTCYALTLAHTGSGSDPTSSPVASPGCEAGSFYQSEVVTLTAASDPGWEVSGWTGSDNDSSTSTLNTVTMPASDHAASVAYIETPVMPDHLHIHDETISSSHTYAACLSITAGPNVELASGGPVIFVIFRAPGVILDSSFSVGAGEEFSVDNAQPGACAAGGG